MDITQLLASIESEIATLQQVRALLAGQDGRVLPGRKPGKKRVLSAEARERIAAAQRKRWAKQKRAAKKAA
jgi:topoisomerase IA-like protein